MNILRTSVINIVLYAELLSSHSLINNTISTIHIPSSESWSSRNFDLALSSSNFSFKSAEEKQRNKQVSYNLFSTHDGGCVSTHDGGCVSTHDGGCVSISKELNPLHVYSFPPGYYIVILITLIASKARTQPALRATGL